MITTLRRDPRLPTIDSAGVNILQKKKTKYLDVLNSLFQSINILFNCKIFTPCFWSVCEAALWAVQQVKMQK